MGKLQKDEAFYKKLWSLMVPIVLQNLMLAMVAVADAFMLGGMDQNYMSAVSLATQIQFIQNMFLAAATASLGILGAQYWGKGDKKTLDEIFCMALNSYKKSKERDGKWASYKKMKHFIKSSGA